jgi:DNA adenine methylase
MHKKTQAAFGWVGSKRRLAKHIIPQIPDHTTYVEAFFGSGAIFLAKPKVTCEVLNDRDHELVNFYRILQNHKGELLNYLLLMPSSRALYTHLRDSNILQMTDIQRAARFYYLVKNAFGGKMQPATYGYARKSGSRHNLETIEQVFTNLSSRLHRVFIENLDWHTVCKKYDTPGAFIYLDPPYHNTIGYTVPFEEREYSRIADFMRTSQGQVMLSINSTDLTRATFSEFSLIEIPYHHGLSGLHRKPVAELIYTNY